MNRILLSLVMFLLVPISVLGCASPAGQTNLLGPGATVARAASLDDACLAAGQLVLDNPEQALDLIEKVRGSYAPQESSRRTDCEPERLAALKNMGDKQFKDSQLKPNAAVDVRQKWDAFVKSWVLPLQNLALAWAGTVLGLLILARLFAFLPHPLMPLKYLPWRHASKWIRGAVLAAGIVLVSWFSWQLIVRLFQTKNPQDDFRQLIILVIGAAAGSFLFATWMASRQRLSVDVRNSKGEANESDTSYVVALLNDLGGSRPRGLEVPRGTDATGLSAVPLSTTFSNGVLAALQKTFESVFGITPWRIAVDSKSDDLVSVVVTRNGWTAGAASISRSNRLIFPALPAEGKATAEGVPALDLYKMAAAFILATLAPHYQGFKGLGGATDWRSIGLHFIATTDFEGHKDEQILLLARAMELDPENLPAEAAMRNLYYRHFPTETTEQMAYRDWLGIVVARFDKSWWLRFGQRGLLQRIRFSYMCVTLNLMAGMDTQDADVDKASEIARKLMKGLTRLSSESESLEKRLRPHAALVFDTILRKQGEAHPVDEWPEMWKRWHKEATTSPAPKLAYNSACSLATQGESWTNVKPRLDAAILDPELKARAPEDPELKAYASSRREVQTYLAKLKGPRKKGWLRRLLPGS